MHGHGSPHPVRSHASRLVEHRKCHATRCLQVAVWLCALVWSAPPANSQDLNLRLWIAWGGGEARRWTGRIQISGDGFSQTARSPIVEFRPVGLTPDEPGSMYIDGATLHITPRSPRAYDGVSLLVDAPPDATLSVELAPDLRPQSAQRIELPLVRLVSEVHSSSLDSQGNRLLVRRAPGDQLRVRYDRDSLVFSPGERFDLFVDPHLVGVEPDTTLSYAVELRKARSDDVLWDDQREARSDQHGDPPEVGPFSITLPQAEGVYDVAISLKQRRLPTRFSPTKTLHERSLQLAVVDSQPAAPDMSAWEVVREITPEVDVAKAEHDTAKSKLWKSLPKLPKWPWLPSSSSDDKPKPLGNGRSRKQIHPQHEFVELLPGGWQAYPLPVAQAGKPHVLEIAYPNDAIQTLGIYILEPDSAGTVTPIGPHSGLDVPDVSTTGSLYHPKIELHRAVFWPRSQRPLLLLANHRDDASAVFGRIRVLAGPARLPVRDLPCGPGHRLLAAYFDRPLFPENFSASDAVDPVTGRNLNDWQTFHDGGVRLVQYLNYAGYSGAMISVLREGAAIYPSRLLESAPRYDNGVFFGTAQDLQAKDVLEMLFRLFDRGGLRLVPALEFAAPLPELESLLRQPDKTVAGSIELVGADGRPWSETQGAGRASGPFYNPLDPQVQRVMRRVVVELVERYRHHRSFAGVAIQLGPETYAQLPDAEWAQDAVTIGRFARDERIVVPGLASGDREQQARYLRAEGRDRWLNWRAARLAEFYEAVQADLGSRVPGARLYLAGADMLAGSQIQSALEPKLPVRLDVHRAMLRVGIDPVRYPDESDIVLLRPYRCAPLAALGSQAVNIELRQSETMDELFADANGPNAAPQASQPRQTTAALFYHEPQRLTLPSFAQVSPFGSEKTSSGFLTHISPAGPYNRQRFVHGLAALDSQAMFDGGWMMPLGQQESMIDLIDVYRRLPARRFETVRSKSSDIEKQPIVVRKLSTGNETYLYVANDSPWPLSVAVDFDVGRPFQLEPLGNRQLPPPARVGDRMSWRIRLEPYDLIGAKLDAPDVNVVDWQTELNRDVFVDLESRIADVLKRARLLERPRPLAVLANPGFELPKQQNLIPGWDHARTNGISVDLDSVNSHDGDNSLKVSSTGPVAWVRSNPFPAPKTGRLSVWMWLRIDDPQQQPPLQLAVEGRLNGQPYYRPARVGANNGQAAPPVPALGAHWAPYLVRVDRLPASGLTDLRVAVDLMGKGEVWVDDIQVFDLWFDKTEINQLIKRSGLANWQLGKGEVIKCERFVHSYWAEFLRRHVPWPTPAPQLAERPEPAGREPPPPPASDAPNAEQQKKPAPWYKRFVPKVPKIPSFFR